jgi:hypothetical protein
MNALEAGAFDLIALYLTIAIIAARYVQHSGARTTLFLAVSRVLIVSGTSLGAPCVLLLAGSSLAMVIVARPECPVATETAQP